MESENQHKVVAFVGNPNCGKTSVFNWITGLNQKVGNFPGVTVDKKSALVKGPEYEVKVMDLPGTYSIYPKSQDELIVTELLLDRSDSEHPDVLVVVLDASNLKRNLYLLTQVADLEIPFVIALNMMDLAKKEGQILDAETLSHHFGCDVIITNGKSGEGIDDLIPTALRASERGAHRMLKSIGTDPEDKMLSEAKNRFADDSLYRIFLMIHHCEDLGFIGSEDRKYLLGLREEHKPDKAKVQLDEISRRYMYIEGVIDKFSANKRSNSDPTVSDKADRILTHRIWGWVVFLFVFFLLFQAVFTIAAYPADWIDQGMGALIGWFENILPQGKFADFVTGGILTGINGVLVFIPQIMILFGLITILEDTGYMARVSFINDRLLAGFGMNGKSVVPIVGGFACAVPSIMAARSINNPRQRLITIFITPLMSCSARLPVYIFLIAFLVEERYLFGFISIQGLYMVGLYMLGVIFSVLISGLLNWFLSKDQSGIFTLEMPSFKSPRWKNVLLSMVNSGKTFVNEAGKIIIIVSMILWALMSYGPGDSMTQIEQKYAGKSGIELSDEDKLNISSEKLEASYAGIIGKGIEPVLEPLGFDWKMSIAVLTSFAAREVFVGTMANIYHVDSDSDNTIKELQTRLMNHTDPITNKPYLSRATAWSLIIFYVFALQCASTVAVVKKETGGWKWPVIQFIAFTLLAWISSFITYSVFS